MSNIRGLSDIKKAEDDKGSQFYSGGLSQSGRGSALNVIDPSNEGEGLFERIARGAGSASATSSEGRATNTVTIYRNGFVLDDGPLRDSSTPENKRFLDALGRGEIPEELQGKGEVFMDMIDKQTVDYTPPPPPAYVAFSGAGASVGVTAASATAVVVKPNLGPVPHPVVDEASPVTTILVRTLTGQRIKIRLNTSATVSDLVDAIRSQYQSPDAFALSAGFPPSDVLCGKTIQESGLLNASITLRKV